MTPRANALLMLDDGTHRWTTVPGGPADPSGKFFVMPPPERITHEGIPFHRVGTFGNAMDPALGVKGDHVAELYHQGVQFVDEFRRAARASDDFVDAWDYLQDAMWPGRRR